MERCPWNHAGTWRGDSRLLSSHEATRVQLHRVLRNREVAWDILVPISMGQPNGNKQAGGWSTLLTTHGPAIGGRHPGVPQLTTLLSILSCSHPSCSSLSVGQFSVTASSTLGTKR